MLGPTLVGKLIRLEPARPEDAALRRRWFADLELSRHWTRPDVPSLRELEESFERGAHDDTLVMWRIDRSGRTIGMAWLSEIDWRARQSHQGMVIGDTADWGKRYGSEVVRLRTAYAFDELGLERLETSSLATNVGMHRALERSGFRQSGSRRRRHFVDGEWHDEVVFELLREDWQDQRAIQPG